MKIHSVSITTIIIILAAFVYSQTEWNDYNKAVQYFQQAKFDSAAQFARKISSGDSLYFYSQLLLGHACLAMDSLSEAKEIFNALLPYQDKRFLVYNGIGLYHLYKYDSDRGIVKIAKKLFATDDLEKARDLFQRAMRLNPEYPDARINYSRALMASGSDDDLVLARNSLEKLVLKYPGNPDIDYYLARCQIQMGDEASAIQRLKKLLSRQPYYSEANLSLAFIYFNRGEYELFSKYYLRGCATLHDTQWTHRLFEDVVDIMSEEEKREVSTEGISGDFFVRFWQVRDPLPVTEINERLVEHYKRLEYARDHYAGGTSTGYDDRGKIYVRYGPPDDYYRSHSEEGFVLENESWVYKIGDDRYNFDFVEKGSEYVLTRDLFDALANPAVNMALPELEKIYSSRAHLSNYYFKIHMALQNLNTSSVVGNLTDARNAVNRYASAEWSKTSKLPISTYNVDLGGKDLNYDFDSFRHFDENRSLWFLDVFYGLQLNQLAFDFKEDHYQGELLQDVVVAPSDNRLERNKYAETLSFVSKDKDFAKYYVHKTSVPLELGKNSVYFELKNNASEKFRIVQKDVVASRPANNLMMSDLLLSPEIHLKAEKDDSIYCRNGFYIQPLPARHFDKLKPLFCYFELYNIAQPSRLTGRCQVEYRIKEYQTGKNLSALLDVINPFKSDKQSQTMVAIVNEMEFSNRNEPVILSFDVSKLPSGTYEFYVEVTDMNTQKRTSSSKLLQLD